MGKTWVRGHYRNTPGGGAGGVGVGGAALVLIVMALIFGKSSKGPVPTQAAKPTPAPIARAWTPTPEPTPTPTPTPRTNFIVQSPEEFEVEAIFELPRPLRFHFSEVADERLAKAHGDFIPKGTWLKALKAAPNNDTQFFVEARSADGTVLGRGWLRREELVGEAKP